MDIETNIATTMLPIYSNILKKSLYDLLLDMGDVTASLFICMGRAIKQTQEQCNCLTGL